MIWFTLALFVVSFIVTALLAPKPDFEDARAGTLDDVQFPRATENAPIPLVLGRVRIKGPNTLWYGDFNARPIREKVKTGLFSSKRVTVGYEYDLGLHLGIAIGPDVSLVEIYLDEELVWSGNTGSNVTTNIGINKPSLFGGYKQGGGWVSNGLFYNGSFNLPVDAYLEGQIGAGDVPAYNGMAHIVFNQAYIGEQNSLRPFAFVVESYTNALNLPDNGKVNGVDMNPMEAMYQVLTDDWRGLGVDPADLNILSMQQVGAVLHAEGNGCSIAISNESDGKRVVQEILRQIDGIMYQDPETGQITVRLIRDDYDVATLPVFDENDIADVKSFTRTTWEEVRAQVKVTYPQRDRDSSRVAIAQDMAIVQTIGKLLTNTISFPFVFDDQLATDLAARNLAQASVPLFRVTLELNRNANQLRPGAPFIFSWKKYGIDQLVMRVQRFDLGSLLDGRIVVEAIQDNFAVADTLFAAPPTSGWVEVVNEPTDISLARVVEMPAFFNDKLEVPATFGIPYWAPLAARPGSASQFYQAAAWHSPGPANETIEDAVYDWPEVPYEGSGLLSVEYDRYDGFQNGSDDTIGIQLNSVIGAFVNNSETEIRENFAGLIVINDEWMAYESAIDNGSGNWTLLGVHRGLFGTTPDTHPVGSRLYSAPIEVFPQGLFDTQAQSQSSTFRFMDAASGITQDITEGFEINTGQVFPALSRLGVRPGNLELEGTRNPNQIFTNETSVTLTWARRNQQPAEIALELDADQDPALGNLGPETYAVDIFVDGVFNSALSSGTLVSGTTSYNIPLNLTEIDSEDVEARVRSIVNSQSSRGRGVFPFQLLQGPGIISASQQAVITYTGMDQDFTIPAGVAQIQFALGGGAGGAGDFAAGPLSGAGGYVEGELPVTPGDIVRFQVGQGGRGGDRVDGEGGLGGWPDGGPGANGDADTGGGGGSTRIWLSQNGGVDWTLIGVAAGGGGSGGFVPGGDAGAGGPNGQDAEGDGGTGGTAAGAVGFDRNDAANITKQGVAISLTDPTPIQTGGFGSSVGNNTTSTTDDGGGGGGGYRGGGGGGGDAQSGGGGANYVSPLLTGETNLGGNRDAITPKMSNNPSYPGSNASVGVVATGGRNVHGNDGWAALYYDVSLPAGVARRYWRILQEGADNTSFYGIGEIQMRETVGGADVTDTAFAIAGDSRATFGPEEAFDNSVASSNAWSVELSLTPAADRWVGQDFGAGNEKDIKQIVIQARGDAFPNQAPNDFRLQWSDDALLWTDALVVTGEPNWSSSEARTYDVVELARRYWRVLIEDAVSSTFYGLNELEFRETVGGPDIATTGFAIAGAFNPGDTPQEAFDGNLSTFSAWSVQLSVVTDPNDRWIGQDFGAGNEKIINEIQIRARDSSQVFQAPQDFRLQWSDDGINWFTKFQVANEATWTAGEERQYSATQAHRYWRLRGTTAGTFDGGALNQIVFRDSASADISIGGTPSAGSEAFGGTALQAFDKTIGDSGLWAGASGAVAAGTSWVAYDFGSPVLVDSFDITARDAPDQNQVWDEWVLEWSDDGINWTQQEAYVDTGSWSSAETRNYTVT